MQAYERTVDAYDLIQAARGRDYVAQAEQITSWVRARRPEARSLLDVACGTGLHLLHLATQLDVAGIDLSAAMLARARARLPNIELLLGDMRTFDLGRRFDAVTCLFSSIGYMLTVEDLTTAVANMARHLELGGVLVIEPWIHPDRWRGGHRVAEAANADGLAVARVSVNGRDGQISTFDLHWTIASTEGVTSFVEPHRMGLYTPEEYRTAMEQQGLTVEHDPEGLIGRGMFIGTNGPEG